MKSQELVITARPRKSQIAFENLCGFIILSAASMGAYLANSVLIAMLVGIAIVISVLGWSRRP